MIRSSRSKLKELNLEFEKNELRVHENSVEKNRLPSKLIQSTPKFETESFHFLLLLHHHY
jgi:hypothetical protein